MDKNVNKIIEDIREIDSNAYLSYFYCKETGEYFINVRYSFFLTEPGIQFFKEANAFFLKNNIDNILICGIEDVDEYSFEIKSEKYLIKSIEFTSSSFPTYEDTFDIEKKDRYEVMDILQNFNWNSLRENPGRCA